MNEVRVGGAFVPSALPSANNVAVTMINRAIRQLKFDDVQATLEGGRSDGVFVCEATEIQWLQFLRSESQVLKSRLMEWRPLQENAAPPGGRANVQSRFREPALVRRGHVFIVELPKGLHEAIVYRLGLTIADAAGTGDEHLAGYNATFIEGDLKEPDLSYGPDDRIGANKPAHLRWNEFHTLKVEVGVSQGWPQLEEKAQHWATIDHVEYVLLICVSPEMSMREHTLYEVNRPAAGDPILVVVGQPRAPIQLPPAVTTIQLDARRLLALPPGVVIPPVSAEVNQSWRLTSALLWSER